MPQGRRVSDCCSFLAAEDASPVSVKKQKTVSQPKKTSANGTPASAVKKTKKVTKSQPAEEPEDVEEEKFETSVIPADDDDDVASNSDDDDEIDAEIQALAAGLDPEDDDGHTGDGPTFKPGQDVGKAPQHLTKKEKKALAAQKNGAKEETGVCYIGRLPHGYV